MPPKKVCRFWKPTYISFNMTSKNDKNFTNYCVSETLLIFGVNLYLGRCLLYAKLNVNEANCKQWLRQVFPYGLQVNVGTMFFISDCSSHMSQENYRIEELCFNWFNIRNSSVILVWSGNTVLVSYYTVSPVCRTQKPCHQIILLMKVFFNRNWSAI